MLVCCVEGRAVYLVVERERELAATPPCLLPAAFLGCVGVCVLSVFSSTGWCVYWACCGGVGLSCYDGGGTARGFRVPSEMRHTDERSAILV